MTAYNIGEGDIKNVRTVLCANDICAANMMDVDVDAMGILDPEGHPNAIRGAGREKKVLYIRSETENKSKKPEFVQK